MTEHQSGPIDATNRAAALFAQALTELQQAAAADAGATKAELAAIRADLQALSRSLETRVAEEKSQRIVLADQLSSLAGALDRLVGHLEGLTKLMSGLLDRVAEPPAATQSTSEPSFPAGGEGVSLTLISVPGFQVLMDIQKALMALEQVANASVERFQDGDSRVLLQLREAATADEIATGLRHATGLNVIVEEARPELLRLRLKVVGA